MAVNDNVDRISAFIKNGEDELLTKVQRYLRGIDAQRQIIYSEYYGEEREKALAYLDEDKKTFVKRLLKGHIYDVRREIFSAEGE